MSINKIRKIIGTILLVSLVSLGFFKPIQEYVSFPKEIVLFQSQQTEISNSMSSFAAQTTDEDAVFTVATQSDSTLALMGSEPGESEMTLELSGLPIKRVDVKVLPDFKVIPGGQSIGVRLSTEGVLVVGHHLIETTSGKKSPGEIAGIQVGDVIMKINGESIEQMSEVAPFVEEAGKTGNSLNVTFKRDNKTLTTELTPLQDKKQQSYRIGLYIRDSAAGIGTMTFYDPKSKKYGALGHVISDMDTKKPIAVNNGKIVLSTVSSIEKGANGQPGEKIATFKDRSTALGNIVKNSPFGIFGELNQDMENGIMDKAMPIALSHQVEEGPAKILTVLKGNEVEEFDIEIVNSVEQKFPATKGMVLKITDPKLLDKTGGIVQGMSGSPIIQNGRVIGAVTHVFVNDPTQGYGVHIEWMLNEAGIDIYQDQKKQKAS